MTTDRASKKYHHGDLRDALIAAALNMLEQGGPGALTLRGLARTVGVSPMAPYHHFSDRADLLAAVAAAGFDRLQQRKRAVHDAGESPRDALITGAQSYVEFMLSHPNLYRLMKGPDLADRQHHPDLQRAAAAPAALLLASISLLLADRRDAVAPQDAAQMLWGLAHGIGTLAIDSQIGAEDAVRLVREGTRAMIDGWLAN